MEIKLAFLAFWLIIAATVTVAAKREQAMSLALVADLCLTLALGGYLYYAHGVLILGAVVAYVIHLWAFWPQVKAMVENAESEDQVADIVGYRKP